VDCACDNTTKIGLGGRDEKEKGTSEILKGSRGPFIERREAAILKVADRKGGGARAGKRSRSGGGATLGKGEGAAVGTQAIMSKSLQKKERENRRRREKKRNLKKNSLKIAVLEKANP